MPAAQLPTVPRRDFDVLIVGGGPAGLSAALVLGRCRRAVLVIDAGHPRNYASRAAHNFLTRDGIPPMELLRLGREEIAAYGVQFRQGVVAVAQCLNPGYRIELLSGESFTGRKLLLATGVTDVLPGIPNLEAFYGLGVHHCPYCDGYEYADQPLAALGEPRKALGLAMNLRTWSPNVTACSHGRLFTSLQRRKAAELGIALRPEPIAKLETIVGGTPDAPVFGDPKQDFSVENHREPHRLARIVFNSGDPLSVSALFFNTEQVQRSDLPTSVGCGSNEKGGIDRDARQRTEVKDVYLAGDASRDVQFVIVAAAEGAKAGMAINADFQKEAHGPP
jgi:thioredoxin reductase